MSEPTRRSFLGQSMAVATSAFLSSAHAADSPANRVTIALIGCGGMGNNHLRSLVQRPDVHLKYLCDCDSERLAASAKAVESQLRSTVQTVPDMRLILDDPEVQAVWIATPDHWHAPATLLALQAGKHVYVEKPCSHNVREGRLMLDAARSANRVVQVGTQSRSSAHIIEAMQALKSGMIGDVLIAKAWNSQLRGNIGKTEPTEPPSRLDYQSWLGPVPYRPYRKNMLPGVWRFWRDFGAGDIGNDGVHEIDIARWGLGVTTHPDTVSGLGSKFFFDDDQEFPDTYYTVAEYQTGGQPGQIRQLIYEQRDWSPYHQEGGENGNAFYGTKGQLILQKASGFKVYGPRNKLLLERTGAPDLVAHHTNFLECVRSGARPNGDIEEGHLSATLCHLSNITTRTRRTVRFDPKSETIVDDAEAQTMLTREYRDHWATPRVL
ncbi:gfo/Idh/MocA family oxidoreductase [bacterium]|nr:gfo/Idh/MocA family oxidoreductase [bacterium]